jgi:hypothetical protein
MSVRQKRPNPRLTTQQTSPPWLAIITAVATVLRLAWDVWRSR